MRGFGSICAFAALAAASCSPSPPGFESSWPRLGAYQTPETPGRSFALQAGGLRRASVAISDKWITLRTARVSLRQSVPS